MKKVFLLVLCFVLAFASCKHKNDTSNDVPAESTVPNCNLLSVELRQKGASVARFSHLIPENMQVSLNVAISENAKLVCSVATISKTARVYFDEESESKAEHQYTSLNEVKTIKITCKDGSLEKKYEIKVIEPVFTEPSATDTVKISVVGFVGGSSISGAKVECFNASNNSPIGDAKTTDSNGNVFFNLERDKHYNFVASKKGRAGSRLSNVYVENTADLKNIVMILHDGAVGFKHIAPEVTKIKLGKIDEEPGTMSDISDGISLNLDSLVTDEKGIFIETKSLSGKFIPDKQEGHEKNFGVIIGIGHGYSSIEEFPISLKPVVKVFSDGDKFKKEGDAIIQRYFLPLRSIGATNGRYTLYVVAYDLAGNRVEKQVGINVIGNIADKKSPDDIVKKFNAELKRFAKPLNTFGLPSENGIETSCNVVFSFDVSSKYVSAVEVYRREAKEAIDGDWVKVITRVYTENFEGTPTFIDNKKGRVFKIVDDSSDLEEGKTYQYKLKVFKKASKADKSDEGFFWSPVASLSVLPAFDVRLMSPYHYEKVRLSELDKLNFSFKISNTNLLKKENADYFAFGLLVLDSETWNSGKTKKEGAIYAANLRYYLDDPEKLEVLDRNTGKWKLYSKFNQVSAFKVKDLLEFKEDGTITIKQNFLNSYDFNLVGGLAFRGCFSLGNIYYWDIQDFGDDYVSIADDKAAFFVKEALLKDSASGADMEEKALSYSMSNTNYEGNAINGRFAFTIVD